MCCSFVLLLTKPAAMVRTEVPDLLRTKGERYANTSEIVHLPSSTVQTIIRNFNKNVSALNKVRSDRPRSKLKLHQEKVIQNRP